MLLNRIIQASQCKSSPPHSSTHCLLPVLGVHPPRPIPALHREKGRKRREQAWWNKVTFKGKTSQKVPDPRELEDELSLNRKKKNQSAPKKGGKQLLRGDRRWYETVKCSLTQPWLKHLKRLPAISEAATKSSLTTGQENLDRLISFLLIKGNCWQKSGMTLPWPFPLSLSASHRPPLSLLNISYKHEIPPIPGTHFTGEQQEELSIQIVQVWAEDNHR